MPGESGIGLRDTSIRLGLRQHRQPRPASAPAPLAAGMAVEVDAGRCCRWQTGTVLQARPDRLLVQLDGPKRRVLLPRALIRRLPPRGSDRKPALDQATPPDRPGRPTQNYVARNIGAAGEGCGGRVPAKLCSWAGVSPLGLG